MALAELERIDIETMVEKIEELDQLDRILLMNSLEILLMRKELELNNQAPA